MDSGITVGMKLKTTIDEPCLTRTTLGLSVQVLPGARA